MPSSDLKITGLAKRYGSVVALAPTDLEVAKGEFLTLLGPSGSGKTTLLSLVAGLAHPDEGQVFINGSDVTYGAPYERDIGLVFQNYALFPHMTVEENIGFPLKMRRVGGADAKRRVAEALDIVRLGHTLAALAARALGRAAAAHRARALPRLPPLDHSDGRAARRARSQAARPDAARDQAHPSRAGHDDHLRHARPGRGDDDVGSHLPDERRTHRAARHAGRALFPSAHAVRGRLPRRVEPAAGGRDRRRRRLDRPGAARGRHGGARARRRQPLAAGQAVRVMVRPQNLAIAPAATDGGTVRAACST